jgi:replicative DNA helicase
MHIKEIPSSTVVTQVRNYIINQGMNNIALSIAQAVDGSPKAMDPKMLRRKLDDLCTLSEKPEQESVEYLESDLDYFKAVDRGRIPTGVDLVDKAIGGGLGAGELGIVVAPFGGGKTAILVNFGASAILSGMHVIHVTMEIHSAMVLMRYDMRLGGLTTSQLRENPKLAKRARNIARKAQGSLTIFDRSHELLTPLGLERILETSKKESKGSLCILDYGDLLRSDRGLEGRRFELGDVYRELRRIAAKYDLPLWTASQATREAARSGDFDTTYIAEDITKAHTADAIVCAIQTEDQRSAGQMILKVDKTRMSAERPGVTVAMDYHTMTLRSLGEDQQIVEKVVRKARMKRGGEE